MALSKQDFIKQGFDAAQNTAAMTPGHEDSMPIFGEGKSWQAKAFAEGFRQGVAARHERDKGQKVGKSQYKPAQTAKETARIHCRNLTDMMAIEVGSGNVCSKRYNRMKSKVISLHAKWGF
jgi:hypothetical protein